MIERSVSAYLALEKQQRTCSKCGETVYLEHHFKVYKVDSFSEPYRIFSLPGGFTGICLLAKVFQSFMFLFVLDPMVKIQYDYL